MLQSSQLASTRVGLNAIFQASFNAVNASSLWYQSLATEQNSTDASELYYFQNVFPRLEKWVGVRTFNKIKLDDYLLTNESFQGGFEIPTEVIEDDKLGSFTGATQNLGQRAKLWPNDLIRAAVIAGGSSLCYDGQYFFDTDHPLLVPGAADATQLNLHTGTALTAANLAAVHTLMAIRKGSDGLPLSVTPNLLIVPESLRFTAKRILEADLVGYLSNASSVASDTNIMKGLVGLLVIPELDASSATTWYLADTTKPLKPLIFQSRRMPTRLDILNRPTDSNVFNDKVVFVGVDARGAAGFGLWQLMDKCTA